MTLRELCLVLVLLLLLGTRGEVRSGDDDLQEFHVYSPGSFQQLTLDYFMVRRKADPTETMEGNSPLMQQARAHAVKRLVTRAEEDLSMRGTLAAIGPDGSSSSSGGGGGGQLRLPASSSTDGLLTSSLSSLQDSSRDVATAEITHASALHFSEQVGQGAISQAGALPAGPEGQWISMAEEKVKRDASLTHHGLLWELGAELAEAQQQARGGLNETLEQDLLQGLHDWFVAGGGRLHLVAPTASARGLSLRATEPLQQDDTVASMPFRLVLCRQTARNVLVGRTGKYLGEELAKTFDRSEAWGLAIFLLHEYHKEVHGGGSKWGPFLRTLRMRFPSTPAVQALRGTLAATLHSEWLDSSDKFMWWSVSSEGPCVPTMKICTSRPLDRHSDTRYNIHQMRWALWVVRQNAVRVRQVSTGLHFLALVPYFGMMDKAAAPEISREVPVEDVLQGNGTRSSEESSTSSTSSAAASASAAAAAAAGEASSGVRFELDGLITIRAAAAAPAQGPVSVVPGIYTDAEFFLRFLSLPPENSHNFIPLKLPGSIPKGSKFHYCLKGTKKQRNSDECRGSYRSDAMFWKSKVLTEWRKTMNLPPRMQELRMWASRLHLYGTGDEARLQSAANHMIAGLPIATEDMPAEEQLMLMGLAQSSDEAAVMVQGRERPPPQLYSAPDPTEDPEAQRAMEELAFLAAQAQNAILHASSGTGELNATQAVLNRTRAFFQHGVLPMAGLDELDDFLLKKIGLVAHCGFESDMRIASEGVSRELLCAMRVHLLNETEVEVFCPASARAWQDNCHDVQFLNYTAISRRNEEAVVAALQTSIHSILAAYPTTLEEDEALLRQRAEPSEGSGGGGGEVLRAAVTLRLREKALLHSALTSLDAHRDRLDQGLVPFQLEGKAAEREALQQQQEAYHAFLDEIRARVPERPHLASVSVDFGDKRLNLTLAEGQDLQQTVRAFCEQHALPATNLETLSSALRQRVPTDTPALLLMLGVVVPSGERKVLAVPEGSNATVETGAFCLRHNVTLPACEELQARVAARIDAPRFVRSVLLALPVDAPDSRTLRLVVRQGEQHDLPQLAADFLEVFRMSPQNVGVIAAELHKRLPAVALSVPVSLQARRQLAVRFALHDNITAVVEGFVSVFDVQEDEMRLALLTRARFGLSPGTFLIT